MEIKFRDKEHEQRFYIFLSRMKKRDCYHQAVAYLMALDIVLAPHAEAIFDFEEDCVNTCDLIQYHGWQTGTSRRTTRLLMNLWNGWCSDTDDGECSSNYTVDEIFCCGYAPYYWEAIKLRYPEYCTE